ncbi:DUF302 domain-containing protein [Thiolapillus sp.]
MRKLLAILLIVGVGFASASERNLVMVRSPARAAHVMDVLKETILEYGYQVAHIQRCDGGMAEFHYKSDFYRVVFFGKVKEVREVLKRHPEMSPYLPLKIAVVAEKDATVLAAVDPRALAPMFPDDAELHVLLARWYNDIDAMLEELRELKKAP